MSMWLQLGRDNSINYLTEEKPHNDQPMQLGDYDVEVKILACVLSQPCAQTLRFFSESCSKFPACREFSGEVVQTGNLVKHLSLGDRVCGILPLLGDQTACSERCVISSFSAVKISSGRSETECLSCLGPAVKGYTALMYHGAVKPGSTVLIVTAGKPESLVIIQLALIWRGKVIVAASSDDEKMYLMKNHPDLACVLDLSSKQSGIGSTLVSAIKTETANLGVDILLDLTTDDLSESSFLPSKWDLIECLAVHGRWITSHPNLQLDPPESLQLFLRNASLSYLFDAAWQMAQSHQGKYNHMLSDIMDKVTTGALRGTIARTANHKDAVRIAGTLSSPQTGVTLLYMD